MKLYRIDNALILQDLKLTSNNLELLKGNKRGQHSIRINKQINSGVFVLYGKVTMQ